MSRAGDRPGTAKPGGAKTGVSKSGLAKSRGTKSGATKSRAAAARAPSQRQLRVAEEVRHVLAARFQRGGFRDPALEGANLTVTEVRVSPDLRNATAFIARLGRSDVDALLPALTRAIPWLRGSLAGALGLRVVPNLSFQPDTTLDQAMRIERLLHQPEVARDLAPPASSSHEQD